MCLHTLLSVCILCKAENAHKSHIPIELTAIEIGFILQGRNITESHEDPFGNATILKSRESEQTFDILVETKNPIIGTNINATLIGENIDAELSGASLTARLIRFEPGTRTRLITFESNDDTIPETSERFELRLQQAENSPTFSCSVDSGDFMCFRTFVVFIIDNDRKT